MTGAEEPRAVIERAVAEILEAVGEDIARPGVVETPARVAGTLLELFAGMAADPGFPIRTGRFPAMSNDLVAVRGIAVSSLCEHHLLPFHGRAHIAYVPRADVVGFSKIGQTISILAARATMQENLTAAIADVIEQELDAAGVIVALECEHMCVSMRGDRSQGVTSITIASRGSLARPRARRAAEAMLLGSFDPDS